MFSFEGQFRKENLRRYLLQCSLAGAVVFVLLMVLDTVTQTVLIAALGASTFIAFAVPLSLHSSPRHLIGGYAVGVVSGVIMSSLNAYMAFSGTLVSHAATIVFGALAMSLAMFLMVFTRTEHPPAAALALGLVLNEWDLLTVAGVMAGVVALSLFKRLVLPMLMDLV
jgi:CBS-domain-containing membrane protein